MKKWIILAAVLFLCLIWISTALSFSSGNYVIIPQYTHSHTKAFCNSENFCQDYEIYCENSEMIRISPITGAAIKFSEDWQDPRNEEFRNKMC